MGERQVVEGAQAVDDVKSRDIVRTMGEMQSGNEVKPTDEQKNNSRIQWLFMGGLFAVLLILHQFLPVDYGDDPFFAQAWRRGNIPGYLTERYQGWTSRIVLEAVVMPLAAHPVIWKALNIFMVLLLVWIAADLFGMPQKCVQAQIFFGVMMWSVPLNSLYSSGCITATTHYLWALTLGLIAMRPLKHWMKGEKCAGWEYVICPLCVLYAADMEQMTAILLGAYLAVGFCFAVHYLRKKLPWKKFSRMYLFQLLLIIGMLAFILSAPGNTCRKLSETESYFPEFAELGFWDKLLMGFIENTHYYLAAGHERVNYIFALLSGILLAAMVQKKIGQRARNGKTETGVGEKFVWLKLLVAAVPFAFYWGIGQLGNYMLEKGALTRGYTVYLLVRNRQLPYLGDFSGAMVAFQTSVYLLVLGCVILTILFLHGRSMETLLQLIILGAGFASRIIIGFSPTLYVSGDRTALFCSVSILIVVLRNLLIYWNMPARGYEKALIGIYIAAVIACNLL